MRGVRLAVLCALVLPVAVAAGPADACASTIVYLAGDDEGGPAPAFYAAEEGDPMRFLIARMGHECGSSTAQITLRTVPGTAERDIDYLHETGRRISIGSPPAHGGATTVPQSIGTIEDEIQEAPESFTISIGDVEGAGLGVSEVPAYIIDNDGSERFLFAPVELQQSEGTLIARVQVMRAGTLTGDASINYALTAATATEGKDYTGPYSGTLSFSGDDRLEEITFKIVNDDRAEAKETLTISLGDQISSSFTIIDNEEGSPPVSKLHHPKHGLVYDGDDDYLLREIHVFTSDDTMSTGESGVARAQLALRRKMKSGACRWWSGEGFSAGPCNQKVWKGMRSYNQNFYYLRFPKLAASAGTQIKNYTAYSRAIDLAGNVESIFQQGRNANTFEIDRR